MKSLIILFGLVVLSGKTLSAGLQELVSRAWVDGDRLNVAFRQPVSVTDARGFRLVGGVARIKSLLNAPSATQLTFSLTDHALPDDQFRLLHWSAMSDLRQADRSVPDWEVPVVNKTIRYDGDGTIYYVSTAGLDTYLGTDSLRPLRTLSQAQRLARPGDYILLRRGDTFRNTAVRIAKSGEAGQYLTFGAYGRGARPIVTHAEEDLVVIADQHYVQVDNWHLQVRGDGEKGVYLMGDCRHAIISNCHVEGFGKPLYGINFGKNDGAAKRVVNPRILNNRVSGFLVNIISTGYPYDGTHEVEGGLIENNQVGKTRSMKNGDGIDAQRGRFHGLVIRKNQVHGYFDDGIDLYGADSVIVEHNIVHSPQQPSNSGQGIKAGGLTRNETIDGHQSSNIIVRYNTVHSLFNRISSTGSQNGINANDGASGQIHGNLVYNVQGHGIVISGPIHSWQVHHNIVVNAEEVALNIWTEGNSDSQVVIAHNVLGGKQGDIKVNTRTTDRLITGLDNELIHQKTSGNYHSISDRRADAKTIFFNANQLELGLKLAYRKHLLVNSAKN